MEKPIKNNTVESRSDDANGRSHLAFVGIGAAIIMGGLWLLYDNGGPYHPDFPMTENEDKVYEGS